jgi:hypothetical protein
MAEFGREVNSRCHIESNAYPAELHRRSNVGTFLPGRKAGFRGHANKLVCPIDNMGLTLSKCRNAARVTALDRSRDEFQAKKVSARMTT